VKQRFYDRTAAAVSLALLAALAGFSYYLAELSEQYPKTTGDRKLVHEPDYFVEHFVLTRVNAAGDPVYRVSADRMLHYPDDDSTEFLRPVLVSLDPKKPLVTLRADRGEASRRGEQTHLRDNVVLTRAASGDQPEMTLTTDHLLLLTEEDIARTDRPVRIEYGRSSLTGVGMEFNNATRVLTVRSKVRGVWAAPLR
jgi:lipopolysaccharide export system protein LptC